MPKKLPKGCTVKDCCTISSWIQVCEIQNHATPKNPTTVSANQISEYLKFYGWVEDKNANIGWSRGKETRRENEEE